MSERPERTYTTGRITTWARRIAVSGAVAISLALIIAFPQLPETIPVHFSLGGETRMGRRSHLLWLIAVMTAIVCGVAWLSRYPRVFNYPTILTAEHAQLLYRTGERTLVWVSASITVAYAGIVGLMLGLPTSALIIVGLIGAFISGVASLVSISLTLNGSESTRRLSQADERRDDEPADA